MHPEWGTSVPAFAYEAKGEKVATAAGLSDTAALLCRGGYV